MILRPVAYLALTGAVLTPTAMAHAARSVRIVASPSSVALRYHYVAGQGYGYKLTVTGRAHVVGLGAAGTPASATSTSATIRYRIVSVDASGTATADVATSAISIKMTTNGQTRTVTSAARTQRLLLGADGSQRGSVSSAAGSISVQSLGTLPPGAGSIKVGDVWSSKATVALPSSLGLSLKPFSVITHYKLKDVSAQGGNVIATIETNSNSPLKVDTTVQGTAVSLNLRQVTTGTILFDATAGQLVSSKARQILHLSIGQGGTSAGGGALINEDITSDTSLTRL